jgi:hypothetical protein
MTAQRPSARTSLSRRGALGQDVTDENGHAPNTGGAFSTATDLLRFAGALVTAH